ncbi:hypothetical protein ACN42_g1407 [Penicillium freii]|uniref:Uncharacterized protein n=1 Tax=Penicillium freii TaxID=48697 RepID=A0A117NRH5_PENFR|nr:hypothetical protein ACN42_g1407 [Penicillium freii]
MDSGFLNSFSSLFFLFPSLTGRNDGADYSTSHLAAVTCRFICLIYLSFSISGAGFGLSRTYSGDNQLFSSFFSDKQK